MLPLLYAVLSTGKRLEGHSAGAGDDKLNAYVAAGISSCHEPITAKEALDRLRLGLYVMIREGSIRRDLAEIAALRKTGTDLRRLILVTDGVTPGELLEKGYMEYVVQKAVDCGFWPMEAIQMATLNPATHFNLDHIIGGIAPGRYADMAILPDIQTIRPELVIGQGRIVAEAGRCLVSPRMHRFQPASLDSVCLSTPLMPADFRIPAHHDAGEMAIRVMDMITDLVSREVRITLPVIDGEIKPDVTRDVIKVAVINRANAPGQKFVGLIHGFGIKTGAFAGSTGWDTAGIVVVGASDVDMAMTVNRIHDLKGGVVVCRDGDVIAELALPIFGLISHLPMQTLANAIDEVNASARSLGTGFRDLILTVEHIDRCRHSVFENLRTGIGQFKERPSYSIRNRIAIDFQIKILARQSEAVESLIR